MPRTKANKVESKTTTAGTTKSAQEFPVLIVTMGRAHRMEIGPRVDEPGYPTYVYFMYWDVKRKGEGRGDDTPMCAIRMTREWYDNYIRDKTIHEWLDNYDKILARFEKDANYEFGCPVCGDTMKRLREYHEHLEGHKSLLKDYLE